MYVSYLGRVEFHWDQGIFYKEALHDKQFHNQGSIGNVQKKQNTIIKNNHFLSKEVLNQQ